jgi:hypothetical protein
MLVIVDPYTTSSRAAIAMSRAMAIAANRIE